MSNMLNENQLKNTLKRRRALKYLLNTKLKSYP